MAMDLYLRAAAVPIDGANCIENIDAVAPQLHITDRLNIEHDRWRARTGSFGRKE